MPTYTVHAPPGELPRNFETADKLVLVKESFSFLAFVLPVVWMVMKRTWIPLILYLTVIAAIQAIVMILDLGSEFRDVPVFLISLWFGFEANTIQRWSLQRKDWMVLAVVTGRTAEDCEQKAMQWWIGSEENVAPDMTEASRTSHGQLHQDDEVFGIFPAPTPAAGR